VTHDRTATFARAIRALGGAVLDVALPRRCGLCGRFDTFLCDRCAAGLPRAEPPRCPTCWGAPDARRGCRTCATVLVPSLDGVRSPYRLDDGARRLVHALKYDGLSALAEPMGQLMADTLAAWGLRPDALVPVPLHRARQRRRGFNQAELLARACAERTTLPLALDVLRRVRATTPQVRTASAEQRRRNVDGAFAAHGRLAGRTVLLIDDVCTTAATLRACAAVLRAAGARSVYGLTFARE
jgi:competence protein ComFC